MLIVLKFYLIVFFVFSDEKVDVEEEDEKEEEKEKEVIEFYKK